MKLTFWGAARQVTGSMYLLEWGKAENFDHYKVLIDCGADMDRSEKPESQYGFFPFDASTLNVVLVTHAHIDHTGNLPLLYSAGYEGQIICTKPTADLAELLLYDSANINQKRAKLIDGSKQKSKKRKGEAQQNLYFEKQVKSTVENVVTIPFNQRFKFADDAYLTFIPAGHLLGAAHILLEIKENGEWKRIGFSGDIGRNDYPLLADPQPMPEVDYLICETTYGERFHSDKIQPEEALEAIIKRTCIDVSGRLVVPSFSVGRTQSFLYALNKLYRERRFEPIQVFTDSPLAHESSKVYERNVKLLNEDARGFYEENDSLFDFEHLQYVQSNKASRAISNHSEPCIIVSASGMVQGGRIEYHIEKNISNPYATILIIGYCSEGTLGWSLLNGKRTSLNIRGVEFPVLAKIERIDVFSGHADQDGLISFVKSQSPEKLNKIFLVHGEYSAMQTFTNCLNELGYLNVESPERGQSFEL